MSGERWAGTGHSTTSSSEQAATEATTAAIAGRENAKLLIVFASERHDLQTLVTAINTTSGGVPLIGCSTAGEIATTGPGDASVVVFAIGGDGFAVTTADQRGIGARLRQAGADLATAMERADRRNHQTLVLLTDALAGDQQEIVRGIYSVFGASVPLVGGCAGDDLNMTATYQFHNDEVMTDALVSAFIASDAPMGIGVRHGWQPVGTPMLVTASQDNVVLELDGRPALEVYLERLEATGDTRHDPATFTRFAINHPLGLARRSGEAHVRFIGEADFERRALVCIAAVTEGSSVWVMRGDEDSVAAATTEACQDALDGLHGQPAIGALAFDCIARRSVLGEHGIINEVAQLAERLDGAPVAGFYTYGEIARTQGVSGFHNETLVVLALA